MDTRNFVPLVLASALLAAALAPAPVPAAEIAVKSLSGPPSELAAHRLPTSRQTAVASSILVVDPPAPRAAGSEAALPPSSNTSFNTSAGVGFSVVQATSQYPYFAPATFSGPNGSRYYFDGWNITCNWGSCSDTSASVQIEPLANSSGGIAIFSISGGEVTSDGTWNLNVAAPPSGPLPVGAPAGQPNGATAVPEIQTLISFDDNVVEVAPEPQPCQSSPQFCPQQPCQAVVEPCPYLPLSPGLELIDGVAPVMRISFSSQSLKQRGATAAIALSALRVEVIDARSRQAIHQEELSFGRLAALPVDAAGAQLIQLPALAAGEYTVRFDVRGNVPGVGPIERTALYHLPVLPRSYRLTGAARSKVLDDQRLELLLEVDTPAAERPHVYAYAEVWTGDGKEPIAWIGGMTQPRTGDGGRLELPMVLDSRWLALAKMNGNGLRLRGVRIQDAETFIPLSQMAELSFTAPDLPRAAALAASEVSLDRSLYVGLRDRTIEVPDAVAGEMAAAAAAEVAEERAVEAPEGGTTNTGIFLVHGWCSNATWPPGHFGRPGRVGGTEVFSDPSASRSHDAFAREIMAQGAARFIDSFTLVAHSQGGAASLHLYAFYWSLLDNATAPRRIQSMGTPYNGSVLMDYYLATGPLGWILGSIFACGPVFDLSTLGSSMWQPNIPGWARNETFFYRTGYRRPGNFWERLQFWRWRCNAASFVIPGWDDGVVADWEGFLIGGRNMGVSESECHLNMNHPRQTDNWNRNDIIDREGRPQNLNLARSATTSASSTYTPGCSPGLHCYFPSRVNDGDRSTALGGNTSWSNNSGVAMPQWVQVAWGTPVNFSRIDLYLTAGYELRDFRLEFRATSTGAWQTLTTVTGNAASFRTFSFTPRTAQAIRVVSLNGSAAQPGYARVNEIEVY